MKPRKALRSDASRARRVLRLAPAFWRERDGNFALITAIVAPLLLGVAGGVTDFFVLQHHRSELQAAADAAAIAAVAEAGFKGWSEASAGQVAAAVIQNHLSNRFSGASFKHNLAVDRDNRVVRVELSQDHYGYFVAGYFTGSPQISVGAAARATGQSTICIITQRATGAEALRVNQGSYVSASGCSAYSNSVDPAGIAAEDLAKFKTKLACSAGGYRGPSGSFLPLPLTDCPPVPDPLAGRAALVDALIADAACDHKNLSVSGVRKSLAPGVYCGGLKIVEAAEVTLAAGLYVIKDGPLQVSGGSSIAGTDIGFVFVGEKSRASFKNDSSISLSGRESGPMAGIVMYSQPAAGKLREFEIKSRNAQKLIGTVYLPQDHLTVGGDKDGDGVCDPDNAGGEDDGDSDSDDDSDDDSDGDDGGTSTTECESAVGAASAWTAIVVRTLEITKGVDLIVNADYQSTPVPAPPGIGPNSSRVLLEN